jgi:L-rhamnose mutarotase
LKITVFDQPFYNFNREKHFHEKPASKWENIIMTANLVEDTIKQKEYMEYHRTQFKKWPEISYGFSKANFQQLLVFRNGRQLMLVISIPKGESLDKLNPQTSENNPRVNDWNSIMSKYQEGIEDAPKGTTWVVFQSLR